jgi:hypothetical protein
MKKNIINVAVTLFCLLTLGAATGQSQTSSNQFKSYIPFQFNIGDQKLAAGEYVIERINRQASLEILVVRNAATGRGMFVPVYPTEGNREEKAQLVFRRYGEVSYLAQLKGVEPNLGLKLSESRAERSLKRERQNSVRARVGGEIVQNGTEYETVTIALRMN